SGPADVADAVSSVLPSPRPELRPVSASQPAEPRVKREATANASAERDTAEPPEPRSARADEAVTARPMHKWPEREPSVQELVTKVHTASLEFRSEPAAEQPILPARTRGLLEPAGPAATDRSSRATTRDETYQPAKIRSIRPDADRASAAVPAEAAGPTIHITIGRVELRTVTSSARVVSAPTPAPAQPALSLDEYLRQRAGGER
ncbi:MAG TPA: hypothetical protein VK864_16975, partial [Longimicrobiales bacterium]|nr:hypothetical protein [Longimicrobiales bacterium]